MERSLNVNLRHLLWLLLLGSAAAQIAGTVRDRSGAAIGNAEVRLDDRKPASTDDAGRFRFEGVTAGSHILVVRAVGFAEQSVPVMQPGNQVDVILQAAGPESTVVVTASRTAVPLSETAESVSVLSAVAEAPQLTIDESLRQVPGFSLFRRTGSRFANPTALGASLRGVGASGASRAVVLFRDVPLNDSFGGWVYWGRVPREEVQRIEVLRGGGSDLYGSDALSGVVNAIPRRASPGTFDAEIAGGNLASGEGSMFAAHQWNKWFASAAGQAFRSDGYLSVARESRGAVDTPVDSRYRGGDVTLGRNFSIGSLFATASIYDDSRHNGTPLQTNSTTLYDLSLGSDLRIGGGDFAFRGFGGGETYHQSFSAIAVDRNSETLTRLQRVPSQHAGGSAQWSRRFSRNWVVAGADVRQVRGVSDELAPTAPQARIISGGRQMRSGFFVRDAVRVEKWIFSLSGRMDFWRNYAAEQSRTVLSTGTTTITPFAERSDHAFNPRVSVLRPLTEHLAFTASGYRSFRAPTLNELYRGFRLGNVQTLSNGSLRAERLTGAEGGLTFAFNRGSARVNYFWADVTDPVANRTLTVTPALITRQRQNLGRLRSKGLEAESDVRIAGAWSATFGYLFVDSSVMRFPVDPSLEGKQVPQVSPHQFHAGVAFAGRSPWLLRIDLRSAARQFEDDQNLLPLSAYALVDAYLSRSLGRHTELFFAAENAFDQRYEIGRTPVTTLGPPVQARAGLRFHLSAR